MLDEAESSSQPWAERAAGRPYNAVRHAIFAREVVLPWEDQDAYELLLESLTEEYRPQGPTEAHLVVELVTVLWRKRRLLRAEAAVVRDSLRMHLDLDLREAERVVGAVEKLQPLPTEAADSVGSVFEDEARRAERALHTLQQGHGPAAVRKALTILGPTLRKEWGGRTTDTKPDEGPAPGADDDRVGPSDDEARAEVAELSELRAWIEGELLPALERKAEWVRTYPNVREHLLGLAAEPAGRRSDNLARYEAHLDRKFERTLAMLLRLRELRGNAPTAM